ATIQLPSNPSLGILAFAPDGQAIAFPNGHDVNIWNFGTRQVQILKEHKQIALSVAFSPDGKTLVSSSADGALMLWDRAAQQPIGGALTGPHGQAENVAFSPDGQTIASCIDKNIV